MARRDAQRLTRRLKDAGAIVTAALKQLEGVLDEIGDHDLSPADMTTVRRQLATQTEAIEQQLQQIRAAAGPLEARAAVGPEPEPRAGRRTGRTRGRPPEAGGGIPPRRGGALRHGGGIPGRG